MIEIVIDFQASKFPGPLDIKLLPKVKVFTLQQTKVFLS